MLISAAQAIKTSRVGGYGRELDLHFDLRKFAQTHEKYIRIRTHSIRNPVSFYLLSSDGAAQSFLRMRGVDGSAAPVRLLPKLHRMVSLGAPFDAQPLACPWGASPSDRTILELLALRLISTCGFEPLEWARGRELIQWCCHAAPLLLRRAKYVRAARAGGSEVRREH